MRLSFSGAPDVAAPRSLVWERLMDPHFLAATAPGVEKVEVVDATHYSVTSGFGLGAVRLGFTLDVEVSGQVPPERATLRARGTAPGSTLDVTSGIRLEEPQPGRTIIHWTTETDVNGAVAGLGGLLEGAARKVMEQFWIDFARRVAD